MWVYASFSVRKQFSRCSDGTYFKNSVPSSIQARDFPAISPIEGHIFLVVMLTHKQEQCIVTLIGEFIWFGWIKQCVGIFVELHRNPCRPPIEAQESSLHWFRIPISRLDLKHCIGVPYSGLESTSTKKKPCLFCSSLNYAAHVIHWRPGLFCCKVHLFLFLVFIWNKKHVTMNRESYGYRIDNCLLHNTNFQNKQPCLVQLPLQHP